MLAWERGQEINEKAQKKKAVAPWFAFFFFFLIFHLALSSPRPSEKVEQVSFSPSLSPPPLSLSVSHFALSFQNQLLAAPLQSAAPSPARASPRRRATPRHLHPTMQGALSGVPLARRAACAPSPSARGE